MAAELRQSREERAGPVALAIKRFNRTSLMSVAGALVVARLSRRRARLPDEADLLLLHETGTRFLLPRTGCYRDFDFHIEDEGRIVFRGAPCRDLPRLMRRFFRELASLWKSGDALDAAVFALWWLAWIHPFEDGNGRVSVAFAYACFCLRLGARLPGLDRTFDSITADAARYRAFIEASDHARASAMRGRPDLLPLKKFLDGLLAEDLAAAG